MLALYFFGFVHFALLPIVAAIQQNYSLNKIKRDYVQAFQSVSQSSPDRVKLFRSSYYFIAMIDFVLDIPRQIS